VIAEADGFAQLLAELESRGVVPAKNVEFKAFDLVLVRGMTLTGKVVDGDTKAAIAGATVVAWSVEGMTSFGGAGGTYISNPWGPRPLGETKSGDDGTFRFEHLPAQGPSGVASHNGGKRGPTLGHVAAWKEGYVFGGDEIPVSKDEATIDETIELWPSATITGRVVDQDGKPVAGATAYVNVDARRPALNGFPSFYAESKSATSTTDVDGRYVLTSFRASRSAPTTGKLTASSSVGGQYLSSTPIDVTADAGATVAAQDLVIDIGAMPSATIVVQDAAGAPVVGALVERPSGSFGGQLRAGLDGRVSWALRAAPKPGVPVSSTSVVVRAKGFASQKVEFTPTLKTALDVTVVMKPGARIAGRVVKADGGAAGNAGILVADGTKTPDEAFGDGSFQAQMSRSQTFVVYAQTNADADGNFEVADLPDGPYLVAAQMSSRAPHGFNTQPKQLRDVRPGVAAGTTDLVFTIPPDDAPPTQALEIVVTDAAGAPVEKTSAWATVAGARMFAQRKDATTLRFDALPAGVATITVRAPAWAPTTVADVRIDASAPPSPLVVRLSRGVKLRGSFRVDSGRLPDGCSFFVSPVGDAGVMGEGGGDVYADGSFEVGGLSPGRWRVLVGVPETSSGRSYVPVAGTIAIPEGRDEVVVDLTVTLAASISLVVRDLRLPTSPYSGGVADPTKAKFGADSRLDVEDSARAVVWTQSPVYSNIGSSVAVTPGDYVVRLTLPGEPAQERRCTVKAGETSSVSFPAK
jgi:protocatechuate 3,4-dioxygenase beta subunit